MQGEILDSEPQDSVIKVPRTTMQNELIDSDGIKKLTDITTTSFQGGNITRNEPTLLPVGGYSKIQNMRQRHPGMEQRGGMAKLHTSATASKILSMFQFSKGSKSERHFYEQRADDDVWEATTDPPGVTAGAFGGSVFTGSASSVPASWSVLDDTLFFANGVDSHQIYPGTASYVKRLIVYKGAAAIPTIPLLGEDYSDEVSDGLTTTAAVLNSLSTLAAYDCVFIMTPVPADTFTWLISATNDTAAVAQLKHRRSDDTWDPVTTFVDNTKDVATSTKTLAVSGTTMTWVLPDDSIPSYMFGECGYWYQLSLASGALDSTVSVTSLTYESDWQAINNVWDGVPVEVIESQFIVDATALYKKFGAVAIEIDSLTAAGRVYFATADPINGFYVDPGSKPNSTATTTIDAVYYYNGTDFTTVSTVSDGSLGMSKPGWVTFARKTAFKHHFNSGVYAYWYCFEVDKTISADVIISLSYQPYFDMAIYGKGQCNCAWKNRMVYGFQDQFLFVSAMNRPQVLNGADGNGVLEAGDGRTNKVLCAKQFNNDLMVWQEEKGKGGGCVTIFEGYSPLTFGKVVISTDYGILNSKCAAVVDGTRVGTPTDQVITKIAFWLSHYGIFMSNGVWVTDITGDIKNYFNPRETECIARGYDNDHWLEYDPAENTINIGLVTATGTVPNVHLVLDLENLTWSHDVRTPYLSCMTNVEAASGTKPILQIGGGVADGFVYLLNTGVNDVVTAIDAYSTNEFSGKGMTIHINDGVVRTKVQPDAELLTLDVAPASTWADGATITGATSEETCVIVAYLTTTTYIVKDRSGTFTLGEVLSDGTTQADQGAAHPTFTATTTLLTLTPYINSISQTAKSLDMTPEVATQTIRRHRENFNLTGQHISMKFQNNATSQSLYLLDYGFEIQNVEGQ